MIMIIIIRIYSIGENICIITIKSANKLKKKTENKIKK